MIWVRMLNLLEDLYTALCQFLCLNGVCMGSSPTEQFKNRKLFVQYNTNKMEYLEYLGFCNRSCCSIVNVRAGRELCLTNLKLWQSLDITVVIRPMYSYISSHFNPKFILQQKRRKIKAKNLSLKILSYSFILFKFKK